MRPRLRLYTGDETDTMFAPPTMTISFGELIDILDDACRHRRTWLRDFSQDDVQIPEDLYDVLTEYARMRPGA